MSGLTHKLRPVRSNLATAIALLIILIAGAVAVGPQSVALADEGCDSNEQVACIPLPSDTTPQPGTPSGAASNTGPAAAVAAPAPGALCAQGSCCPPPPGPFGAQPGASAVPAPGGGGACYPPNWCLPAVVGAAAPGAASAGSAAAVPAVPVPQPNYPQYIYCSPYRSIYTTINLGNAADVRALRTLSPDALRPYWRGAAFSDIASQISQLQATGDYATPRLYSIQVQSASLDLLSSMASVRTLEHWLYEEHSLYDGSLVSSQDEWVSNSYLLTFNSNGWYITGDRISLVSGPQPIPLGAFGP